MGKCKVCYEELDFTRTKAVCPHCAYSFHKDHLPELMDKNTPCPVCKHKILGKRKRSISHW